VAVAPWAIVLAGGRGRRLRRVTGGVAKQFWAPPGSSPLLSQTIERLSPLVPPDRVVTVVGADQRLRAEQVAARHPIGHVIYQPEDRGTAAGILLGLSEIASHSVDARVIVTPSDHAVAVEGAWRGGLEAAAAVVEHTPEAIVLFGAQPTEAVGDYGWIEPVRESHPPGRALSRVGGFVEKPPLQRARQLLTDGAVWNTMVVVGTAHALFDLIAARLPGMAGVFIEALQLRAGPRALFLEDHYRALPSADFSKDVLERTPGLWLYTWPASMGWTDLGTPARLQAWIAGSTAREGRATGLGTGTRG